MNVLKNSTNCACCGKEIPAREIEPTFRLPDTVFARRHEGTKVGDIITDDMIDFDNVCYIRSLMSVPIHEREDPMYVGVWVEVSQEDFYEYFKTSILSSGVFKRQKFTGKLSNALRNYPELKDVEVELLDHSADKRPAVIAKDENSPLGQLQRIGIKEHDIINFFNH